MKQKIYFSSLANNQTNFWMKICSLLNEYDCDVLCFDSESLKKNKNIKLIDCTYKSKKINFKLIKSFLKKYKINNLKKVLKHEILYFGKRNNSVLLKKLIYYLYIIELQINVRDKDKLIIFQELGGFAPNLALYYFCKLHNIQHFFIEPSFFSGRFHVVENGYKNFQTHIKYNEIGSIELKKLLKNIVETKSQVIPKKDISHFNLPIKKFFRFQNFFRFFYKLFCKNFLNYEFVFYQDLKVIKLYLDEIFQYLNLKSEYRKNLPKKFVYFPLHVPNDVALTLREPLFQNQLKIIDQLCMYFQDNNDAYHVCVKEHPARVGALQLKKILERNKNLVILDPKLNNFDIFKKASLVFTINSKAGYEAILLGSKVISFSDSFYSNYKMSFGPINPNNLKNFNLRDFLNFKNNISNEEFFRKIFENTNLGDLYFEEEKNLIYFSQSIKKIINKFSLG